MFPIALRAAGLAEVKKEMRAAEREETAAAEALAAKLERSEETVRDQLSSQSEGQSSS